ncbi:VRR-NUC domain-containing protein [Chlamydoabsidia padenii]|nr:VRR-NUC domain-containing protein [Chlamydoabsidia padenii]
MFEQNTNKRSRSAKSSTVSTKKHQLAITRGQKKIDLFFKKPAHSPPPDTTRAKESDLIATTEAIITTKATTNITNNHGSNFSDLKVLMRLDSASPTLCQPHSHETEPSKEDSRPASPIPETDRTATATTTTPFFENSMYTDQVHHMLTTVLDGESFLFTDNDLDRFEQFKKLPLEPQHLFVRLWMRKQRRWLRLNKLDYSSNIRDIHQATAELTKCGMVQSSEGSEFSVLDWSDILDLLTVDELKDFALCYQCQPNDRKLRSDYLDTLTAARQQALQSNSLHGHNQIDKFMIKANEIAGPCILLDQHYDTAFHRLNIVYYRLSDPTESNSMRTAILAKLSRQNYPDYVYCRTANVWTSKEELDCYEKAFRLQYEFETKMESIPFERRKQQQQKRQDTDDTTGGGNSKTDKDLQSMERQLWMDCWLMCENIIGIWEDLVQRRPTNKDDMGDDHRGYYMRRFEAGYIYTHILEHGTKALSKLQEYSLEALVLQKLIDQRIYRQGKRGKWYDRLALIQANYLKDIPERQRKKMALQTCISGIQDPRVHQTHLSTIQRRIQRLERDLCIPKREQHDFSYLTLKKPSEKIIHAERISDTITGKKSSWRGDDGAEISVEHVAIQYYNKQGYQGLHAENGVVIMLFMLLFWDIVFSPIPGAFETPYQSAPLDLWSDAFYVERVGMINERLAQICQEGSTLYLDIIKQVDDQHRPLQTLCAGVNWNYEQHHLLEVAECIGPQPLSALCKLLAEEFGHRQGGMPDLCCWNYNEKRCLFVEVKGPGDKLSETQKIWLDTLTNMGIPSEVCYVKVWDGEDELLN